MATRVVFLGGGYVTVWAYRQLLRHARPHVRSGAVTITVVAPHPYHSFHGWTAEVLERTIAQPRQESDLRRLLPAATYVQGHAAAVDADRRTVTVQRADGHLDEVPYDELVVGTGSVDDTGTVPGLAAHAWSVKEPSVRSAVRTRLHDLAARPRSGPPVVVVGGGLAGIEMAAAVARTVGSDRRAASPEQPAVVLIHSGAALGSQLRPRFDRLADYAVRQLDALGVEVRTGSRLAEVTADGLRLADGSFVASAMVISTLGQRPVVPPGLDALVRDEQGRLRTDRMLRVAGREHEWAAGDVAHVERPWTGGACPADALWAIKAGAHLGRNLARAIAGRPVRPFRYPGLGRAMSFGVGRGAVELYGVPFTGWSAWVLRLVFFLRFMPLRRQAAAVVRDLCARPLMRRPVVSVDG